MTCQNCGAPMRMDRDRNLLICDSCHAEAVPPLDEGGVEIAGETAKSCPVCQSNLFDAVMESQALLYCQKCHGFLLPMDRFLPLVERLRSLRDRPAQFVGPRDNADADRHLRCPLCDQDMIGHPYAGAGNVNIDTCERCSMIWLDRNELRRIVVAPDPQPLYSRYDAAGESDRD